MTYEYDDDAYPEDRREAFYWGGDIPDQEEEDDIPSDGRYDHDAQHARGALPTGGPGKGGWDGKVWHGFPWPTPGEVPF